jgi:hypothetical protein
VTISPKVYLPTLIAVVAGIVLWLITGDKTALIVCLTGLAGGGIGAVAPPAPKVSMSADVIPLSRKRRRRR